ncbi:cobyric acid synthase [Halorussus aquaticus]|uniref:Probable cobyric acid synthase n=1 Tax=Halorussus aquaticus TaxID=2953748 RepID=A0ABD5PZY3_9EURY|nr:cobyric acid synthase [Halorussus aquaticus]
MTRTLLVAGTASHVGKSTVAAGLCRLLADAGVSVAPYKAQNMSNNARAVLSPESGRGKESRERPGEKESDAERADWGEIGVSQYVQAEAARVTPTTDTNPVLLKPRGEGESQLVVQGEAVGHFEAGSYYDDHWDAAREAAVESYRRLADDHDVVVAEGAGSIAEINLHDRDLANVETARFADADVLLVADIERGGAFASLYGTLELMPEDVRQRVVGAVITKFRGDQSILDPGVAEFEDRTGVPILGVLPYDDPGLPEEDSVSLPPPDERAIRGDDAPDDRSVTVAVPRLSRVSNVTDLGPLEREAGVRVAYVPPDATLADADAVVVPGTKNTVDDLLELRDAGFGDALAAFDGPVVGLCGGYQMLGERIANAGIESTGDRDEVAGFGLLPVETRFSTDKRVEQVVRAVDGVGPIADATGEVSGYEIHMGDSEPTGEVARPLGEGSAATEETLGTYLHGLFENETVRSAFVARVFESAGKTPPEREETDESPYDAAAALLRDHVDLSALGVPEA